MHVAVGCFIRIGRIGQRKVNELCLAIVLERLFCFSFSRKFLVKITRQTVAVKTNTVLLKVESNRFTLPHTVRWCLHVQVHADYPDGGDPAPPSTQNAR